MSKCKTAIIASVAMTILYSAFWVAAQEKTRVEIKRVTAEELRKMELERAKAEATPVQKIAMTRQQKEHGKLYKQYSTGRKLRDSVAVVGDMKMHAGCVSEGGILNAPPFDYYNTLKKMSGISDAVIIGLIQERTSLLTEDEDYIFTDYEISVNDILKENTASPIRKHGKITFTRPGGCILLDGHLIEAVDDSFLPLHKGLQYLLFLKYIPETDSYQAVDSKSSFLLLEGKVIKLTKGYFPLQRNSQANMAKNSDEGTPEIDVQSFLSDVNSAIATSSANK